MDNTFHPAAAHHLPIFITPPGQTDTLLVAMAVLLVLIVLAAGVFFFWLHSLPERMVHNKIQFDIVAVLLLLSLFTHVHAFWVAALLLALVRFPDLSALNVLSPLRRMAASLEKMGRADATAAVPSLPQAHASSNSSEPAPMAVPASAKPSVPKDREPKHV